MTNKEIEVVKIPMEDVPLHPLLRGKKYEDPRPDLEDDSDLWLQVIIQAEKRSLEFAQNIYDLRGYGTRIQRGKTEFFISPIIDDTGTKSAWTSKEIYLKYRDKLLGPYRQWIREILEGLFEWR